MLSFESDYIAGAHPDILRRLAETNLEPLPGYGTDKYCDSAREKIRAAVGCPGADVELLAGGTQTNALIIAAIPTLLVFKNGQMVNQSVGVIPKERILQLVEG